MEDDEVRAVTFLCPHCNQPTSQLETIGREELQTYGILSIHPSTRTEEGYYTDEETTDSDTISVETNVYICPNCEEEIINPTTHIQIFRGPEASPVIRPGARSQPTPEIQIIDREKPKAYQSKAYTDLPGRAQVAECPTCANTFCINGIGDEEEITCTNQDCQKTFTLEEIIKEKNADLTTNLTITTAARSLAYPPSATNIYYTYDRSA